MPTILGMRSLLKPLQTIQLISQLLDAKVAFRDIFSGEVLEGDLEWLLLGLLESFVGFTELQNSNDAQTHAGSHGLSPNESHCLLKDVGPN